MTQLVTKEGRGPALAPMALTKGRRLPRRVRRDRAWRTWLVAWVGASAIGIGNAALREAALSELGDLRSHQISTATLIAFLGLYMAWVQRRRPLGSSQTALEIGVVWALFTIAFEFALGLGVTGDSVADLLANYNLAAGRLWALVPLWMLLGPYVFYEVTEKSVRREVE
jgi:hypothetical protein